MSDTERGVVQSDEGDLSDNGVSGAEGNSDGRVNELGGVSGTLGKESNSKKTTKGRKMLKSQNKAEQLPNEC